MIRPLRQQLADEHQRDYKFNSHHDASRREKLPLFASLSDSLRCGFFGFIAAVGCHRYLVMKNGANGAEHFR